MRTAMLLLLVAAMWGVGQGYIPLTSINGVGNTPAMVGGVQRVPGTHIVHVTQLQLREPPNTHSARINGCVDLERRVFSPLATECRQ